MTGVINRITLIFGLSCLVGVSMARAARPSANDIVRSILAEAGQECFLVRQHVKSLQERGYLLKMVLQVVETLAPAEDELKGELAATRAQLKTAGEHVAELQKEVAKLKEQVGQQQSQGESLRKVRAAAVGWARDSLIYEVRQFDRASYQWTTERHPPRIDQNALWPVRPLGSDAGKHLLVDLSVHTFYSAPGTPDRFVVKVNRETLVVEGAKGRWEYVEKVFGSGVD